MDNKTKIILSVIGVSAVLVPLGLLMFLSSKQPATQSVTNSSSRKIDTEAVNRAVQSNLPKVVFATPSPSSPTARPLPEGTRSAY